MNFDNMIAALEMMGQGMLGIFVVLGMIALLVYLMQKVDNRKKLVWCTWDVCCTDM